MAVQRAREISFYARLLGLDNFCFQEVTSKGKN